MQGASFMYSSPGGPTFEANGQQSAPTPPAPGTPGQGQGHSSKKQRSKGAKIFQCTGYGDCNMTFSRSEHLARHIRKHTGERPFRCHCGRTFSRLDNLRQHVQTVHANESHLYQTYQGKPAGSVPTTPAQSTPQPPGLANGEGFYYGANGASGSMTGVETHGMQSSPLQQMYYTPGHQAGQQHQGHQSHQLHHQSHQSHQQHQQHQQHQSHSQQQWGHGSSAVYQRQQPHLPSFQNMPFSGQDGSYTLPPLGSNNNARASVSSVASSASSIHSVESSHSVGSTTSNRSQTSAWLSSVLNSSDSPPPPQGTVDNDNQALPSVAELLPDHSMPKSSTAGQSSVAIPSRSSLKRSRLLSKPLPPLPPGEAVPPTNTNATPVAVNSPRDSMVSSSDRSDAHSGIDSLVEAAGI